MRTTLRALLAVACACLLAATGCGGERAVGGTGSLEAGPTPDAPRLLRVGGAPYEMGWHHGRLLRDEIRAIVAAPVQGEAAGMYAAYAAGMRALLPAPLETELQGIAAGAGVSPDDLFLREAVRDARRWHDPAAPALEGAVVTNAGDAQAKAVYTARARASVGSLLVISRAPAGGTPTLVLAWPGALGAVAGRSGRGVCAVQVEEGDVAPEQRTLRALPFAIGFRLALEGAADAPAFVRGLSGLVGNTVAATDAAGSARIGLVRFGGDPPGEAGLVTRPENLFAAPGDLLVVAGADGLWVGGATYRGP